jgi:bacteriocin-like protein
MLNQQHERVLTRMGARELTSDELAKVSGGVGGTGCQLTGSPRTFQDIICDCPDC